MSFTEWSTSKLPVLHPGENLFEELLMDEEGLQTTENHKMFIYSDALPIIVERMQPLVAQNEVTHLMNYLHTPPYFIS